MNFVVTNIIVLTYISCPYHLECNFLGILSKELNWSMKPFYAIIKSYLVYHLGILYNYISVSNPVNVYLYNLSYMIV